MHAHRAGTPKHERSLAWIRHLAEGPVPWALPVFCLGEFVRVVTHPRVFDRPSSLEEAWEAIEGLLESPTLRVLYPGERYPALFHDALEGGESRGNLAFDAQIVAVCRERGASRLLTLDRDFARFPGVAILSPDDEPDA